MKRVLILAIGCQLKPWDKMIETSLNTWDSVQVPGVESIFYCGNPVHKNTSKIIYFPINEAYKTMGEKMICAFEWALKYKEFDYIARVNGSCYVNKNRLIEHVQTLPEYDLFSGIEVPASEKRPSWMWGGGQFILSWDLVQKICDKKEYWNHSIMEDEAISEFMHKFKVPFHKGKMCSIDKTEKGWSCIMYGGGESFEFTNFSDLYKLREQFFVRVKHDLDRSVDEFLMKQLYQHLELT
jgi:hypothetical protein